MLEHPDGRDAVERPVAHVPVVLQPDLDLLLQPGGLDPVAGPPRLRRAERHPDHLGAVVPGCVDREGSPPAPDVEDPLSRLLRQPELAADEVVLRLLGGLEGVDARGEPSAGVRHGGPEHHGVEVVADVVVMLHRLGVATP